MKQWHFQLERNGASLTSVASTPSFTLDIAVVVIDRMTAGYIYSGTAIDSAGPPSCASETVVNRET
jgi:hypothetical protein